METHYQTLEDAPSDSESSWQPVQEEQSRQERIKQRLAMTLRSFGHGPPMDIDDFMQKLASQLERFKHYMLSLWSMIYDTFLWARLPAQRESLQQGFLALRKWLGDTLICLALVAAAWYAWAFFASCLRHELAASAPAAEVWSLSYPQGGGIPAEQPFQLHLGSFVAISPQLLATAGVSCSVEPVLPVGLVLDASTCAIQGVPEQQTAGVEMFTVTASSSQAAVSVQLSLAVAAGKIYTVAGSRTAGFTVAKSLPGMQQKLSTPRSLCAHRGKLYIGQEGSIAEMDLHTGKVQLLLGSPGWGSSGNGELKEHARVGVIQGMAVFEEDLYFSDYTQHTVRKVGLPGSRAPGLVSHVAGRGSGGFSGDGGPAVSAELNNPWGLAIVNGRLLIADCWNHCVRAVDLQGGSAGIINTVARQGSLSNPTGLLVVGQIAYVADWGNHRICSIDFQQSPPRIITSAGGGEKSINGAPVAEWRLTHPTGLSLSIHGKMYITCREGSHTVVAMDMQKPHYPASLVAGTGVQGDGEDFIPATSSALNQPYAVIAVGEGSLYIAEAHCIRRVAVRGEALGQGPTPPTKLMDTQLFLGTWSSLKADGTLASPFSLAASTAYFSPVLSLTSKHFNFALRLKGSGFPPSVLGVADLASIKALTANLRPDGSLMAGEFKGVGIMLAPQEEYERVAVAAFVPGMVPSQVVDAVRLFVRTSISLTGSVRLEFLGDGSCKYTLRDVLLDGLPSTAPSFNVMTTSAIGMDVPMHVFMAAWGTSSELSIIVSNPPVLDSS